MSKLKVQQSILFALTAVLKIIVLFKVWHLLKNEQA